MKRQRRRIYSKVKPDRARDHHDEDETQRREQRNAGTHMGGHEQPTRRSGHRQPTAFQNMGKSAYA
jgi:hypothetical protein